MALPDDIGDSLIDEIEEYTLKRRAFDEAPFGITVADMTQEDEPLVYINRGFERITGYDSTEILGQNCRFLQGEETDHDKVDRMRDAIENRDSVQVVLRNYRKDGSMFWCEVTLAPIASEEGEVTHYVGFQQDVTKRKENEELLREQRDDLSILNEMIRHDIRNDLQVALASLEVLQIEDPTTQSEQIETAIESIHQAISLTNTAREVAEVMLDTGTEYEPVSLGQILDREISECRASYPDIKITTAGSLPQVNVEANELLDSVFRNLIVNAATHNEVANSEIRVAGWTTDVQVHVTISDNGPGLSESATKHLFEKGWSSAESTGTGLGLYIANRLLHNYGGDISVVDSVTALPGEEAPTDALLDGATFIVSLPLAR